MYKSLTYSLTHACYPIIQKIPVLVDTENCSLHEVNPDAEHPISEAGVCKGFWDLNTIHSGSETSNFFGFVSTQEAE